MMKNFYNLLIKAKWNIYSVALQDLTFYTLSYLKVFYNYQEIDKANKIYEEILDNEIRKWNARRNHWQGQKNNLRKITKN